MGKIAVFPGTFDPFTKAHQEIVELALNLFDEVKIAVLENSNKSPIFPADERGRIIRTSGLNLFGNNYARVSVVTGLSTESIVKTYNADCIIRGLRNTIDFENEMTLAAIHKQECSIDTIFIPTPLDCSYISSSFVREMIKLKKPIGKYVGGIIARYYQP